MKIIKIGQKLWPGEPFQYFKPDFLIRLIRNSGFFWLRTIYIKRSVHRALLPLPRWPTAFKTCIRRFWNFQGFSFMCMYRKKRSFRRSVHIQVMYSNDILPKSPWIMICFPKLGSNTLIGTRQSYFSVDCTSQLAHWYWFTNQTKSIKGSNWLFSPVQAAHIVLLVKQQTWEAILLLLSLKAFRTFSRLPKNKLLENRKTKQKLNWIGVELKLQICGWVRYSAIIQFWN